MLEKSPIASKAQKLTFLEELSLGMVNSNTLDLAYAITYRSVRVQDADRFVALNVFSNFLNLPVEIAELVSFISNKNIVLCEYKALFTSPHYSEHYRCAGCNHAILVEHITYFQLEQCCHCGSSVQMVPSRSMPDKESDFSYKYEVHPAIELDTDCNPVDINRCAFLVWHLVVHGLYYVLSQNRHLLDIDYAFLEAIAEAAPQKDLTRYLIGHVSNDLRLFSGMFNLAESGKHNIVNYVIDSVFTRIAPHLQTLLSVRKHKDVQKNILSEIKRVLDDFDVRRVTVDCFRLELQVKRLFDPNYERKNAGYDLKLKWINRMLTVEEAGMIQGYARQNKRLIRNPAEPSLIAYQNTVFLSSTSETTVQEVVFFRELFRKKFKDIFTGMLTMNTFMVLSFNGLVKKDWFIGKAVSDVLPHLAEDSRRTRQSDHLDREKLYAHLAKFNQQKARSRFFGFFGPKKDEAILARFRELSSVFADALEAFKTSLKALLKLPERLKRYLFQDEYPEFKHNFTLSKSDIKEDKIPLLYLLNFSEDFEFRFMHTTLRALVNAQNRLVRGIRRQRNASTCGLHDLYYARTRSLFAISSGDLLSFQAHPATQAILESSSPDPRFQQEKTVAFDFVSINEHFFREFAPTFPELRIIPANRFNFQNSVCQSTNDNLSVLIAKFGCETTRHFLTVPVSGQTAHTSEDVADFEALKTLILCVIASSSYTRDTPVAEVLMSESQLSMISLGRFKDLRLKHLYALYCHLEVRLIGVTIKEFDMGKERQRAVKDQEIRKDENNQSEHVTFETLCEMLRNREIQCNTEHKISKPVGELIYGSLVRFCSRYYSIQKRESVALVDRLRYAPRVRSEWFEWDSYWATFMRYLDFHYFDIDACVQLLNLVKEKMLY